jgi:hypothetical protein
MTFLKMIFRPEWGRVAYERWEWIVMRVLFAVWIIPPSIALDLPYHGQPRPAGIARLMDITWFTSEAVQPFVSGAFYIFLALYLVGFLPLLATTGLFVLHLLGGTLANSQGATFHTVQIVGVLLLGQILAHVYSKVSLMRKKESLMGKTPHGLLIYCTTQMLAAAYVVAGLTKLLRSRGNWLEDSENLPTQIAKGLRKEYYDTLVEPAADAAPWFIRFMEEWPLFAKAALGGGWFLELFCFIALLNRWMMLFFGLGLVLMHETISSAMGLGFAFNKSVLLVCFINVPFWLVAGYRWWKARRK